MLNHGINLDSIIKLGQYLRNKGDKDINEIETCLNALYGVMMLKLQGKPLSVNTENAIKEITIFIGMLSDYYLKDKTEGLVFE